VKNRAAAGRKFQNFRRGTNRITESRPAVNHAGRTTETAPLLS
jgi:hypothetical protein